MAWRIFRKMLLIYLFILTTSPSTGLEYQKRHIQRDYHIQTQSTYDPYESTSKEINDDLISKPEKKVSYALMGGHIKIDSSKNSEEDEASWDGLILSSAGNGKEKKSQKNDDDEKKTLAQQVKEGKYGLIQDEIYSKKPKRPGIISYLSNPEVPRDNAKSLGGLDKEDIWLAENHMLVLKGGSFPGIKMDTLNNEFQDWPPIDDYEAPKRQVRIPSSPKVPPPFPIQLTDGGPIKILGTNETVDAKENASHWIPDGLIPFNETLLSQEDREMRNETREDSNERKIKAGSSIIGVIGPFLPSLPPGAVFVPPPNQTDYDDDDQSIYYPPPYSFKYNQDNSTTVPPGPLVPGIILPPPPDFFSPLEEKKPTEKHSGCSRCGDATSKYPTKSTDKTSTIKQTYSKVSRTTKEPVRPFTMKPVNKLKQKTASFIESVSKTTTKTTTTDKPNVETTTPYSKQFNELKTTQVTTMKPIVISDEIELKDDKQYWNKKSKLKPIVPYYPSSTPATDYEPVEATPAAIKSIITTEKRPGSLASYYFYEEASNDDGSNTNTVTSPVYFQPTTPTPSSYYKVKKSQSKKKNRYYDIDITPSQQTAEDYSVQVIDSFDKKPIEYDYESVLPGKKTSRVQGQRMLTNTSPLYYETITNRPQLNLDESYYTTAKSIPLSSAKNDDYHQVKSKPVYQYSFEATNYSPRDQQPSTIYKNDDEVEEVEPQQKTTFNEWQDIQDSTQDLYDYHDYLDNNQYKNNNYKTTNKIRSTTPSPMNNFYTKNDEQLLDDVTKEYFVNFGRKIKQRIGSTTPIYSKSNPVTERPGSSFINDNYQRKHKDPNRSGSSEREYKPKVSVNYGDQPTFRYSLSGDTNVNYKFPLPPDNPDAEYLPGYGPGKANDEIRERIQPVNRIYGQSNLSNQRLLPILSYSNQQQIVDVNQQSNTGLPTSFIPLDRNSDSPIYPIPLDDDIAVNYRPPSRPNNPDAEFIDPNVRQTTSTHSNTYYAYKLPGNTGHVYFITPHAVDQRQNGHSGYLDRKNRHSRLIRRRRIPSDNL